MKMKRIAISIVAVVAVGGALVARRYFFHPPVHVEVTLGRATQEQAAELARLGERLRALPRMNIERPSEAQATPTPATTAAAPAEPTEVFDCKQLVTQLEKEGTLDQAGRKDLHEILSTIADTQEEITRFSDPAVRARLQDNLIHQLVVRLRLVLGDEKSAPIAAMLTQKRPYLVFDGEN